jgi:hypothetical protein
MSDFLSHLIDRALERGPKLDRRKPSRFEPVAMETASLSEESNEKETITSPQSGGLTKPEPTEVSAQVSTAGQNEAMRRKDPVRLAPSVQPAPIYTKLDREEPPSVARPGGRDRIETHTHEFETVVETRETRVIEREGPRLEAVGVERIVTLERATAPPVQQSPIFRIDQTIAIAPPAAKVIAQEVPRAVPRPGVGPQTPGQALRPHSSSVRKERVVEPTASTVTVTIGRVEIRTPQTTKTPAKESRRVAPKLSLEDYLRGRGAGAQ